MDLDLMSFIWAILLVPIGALGRAWGKQKEKIECLTLANANLKKDVEVIQGKLTDIDGKLVPLGVDLRKLNDTILRAELDIEKRLHSMTLTNLQQHNHTKE